MILNDLLIVYSHVKKSQEISETYYSLTKSIRCLCFSISGCSNLFIFIYTVVTLELNNIGNLFYFR